MASKTVCVFYIIFSLSYVLCEVEDLRPLIKSTEETLGQAKTLVDHMLDRSPLTNQDQLPLIKNESDHLAYNMKKIATHLQEKMATSKQSTTHMKEAVTKAVTQLNEAAETLHTGTYLKHNNKKKVLTAYALLHCLKNITQEHPCNEITPKLKEELIEWTHGHKNYQSFCEQSKMRSAPMFCFFYMAMSVSYVLCEVEDLQPLIKSTEETLGKAKTHVEHMLNLSPLPNQDQLPPLVKNESDHLAYEIKKLATHLQEKMTTGEHSPQMKEAVTAAVTHLNEAAETLHHTGADLKQDNAKYVEAADKVLNSVKSIAEHPCAEINPVLKRALNELTHDVNNYQYGIHNLIGAHEGGPAEAGHEEHGHHKTHQHNAKSSEESGESHEHSSGHEHHHHH